MAGMQNFTAKAKTVLSTFVLWATFVAFALGAVIEEVRNVFPDSPVANAILSVLAVVVAVVGVAITVIRRVTPVLPEERGILPKEPAG